MDIITEARKYKKEKKCDHRQGKLRVAVIGTASIQYFVMVLEYLLHLSKIDAEFYEGVYDGITMDVFDGNSQLYRFKPQIVIILTHYTDIKTFPDVLAEQVTVEEKAKDVVEYYIRVWQRLEKIDDVQILQSNFAIPPERILGNLETRMVYSKTRFYREINDLLVNVAPRYVTILDLDLLSSCIGKYQWFDYKSYFLSKSGYKMDYVQEIAELYKTQIISMLGKTKKCLVLDLDNTLWGGVVGDEGYDGIQLDPNNAVGEAYRYFQSYVLELKKRGVILAVCSKNDEKNAKEPFMKNANMILKMDDISCFIANWDDKVTNIKRIAHTLNIGIDSMVFFDDNAAEREIVKKYLPGVRVIEVPDDPALYAAQLDRENAFNWIQLTREDIIRNKSYTENHNRQELVLKFENYDEYLRALEMVGRSGEVTEKEAARFTQLLNKSNQFNLRTQRYTEEQIYRITNSEDYKCLYMCLQDKFGEYGLISCVILHKLNENCFIESWVMSCRVLKRGVENLMFSEVIKAAIKMECKKITGEYIRSKKNEMVMDFYDSLGFVCIDENNETKEYEYDLRTPYEKRVFIKLE